MENKTNEVLTFMKNGGLDLTAYILNLVIFFTKKKKKRIFF